MFKKTLVFTLFSLVSTETFAQYYKTLPKGVRMAAYRNVTTSKIKSSFNQAQKETPYSYEIPLDAKTLSGIAELKPLMKDLKELSPKAYNQFSAGTYQVNANAQVNVNAIGFGYGITNKFTVYAGVPYYNAHVDVRLKRKSANNYAKVADTLEKTGNTTAQSYADAIENMVDINSSVGQSAAVNTLGYKEVGQWDGQALGDTEIGALYNLTDDGRKGTAMVFGLVAPTGYVEDPDIMQDISFGDGQWDGFLEYGGGINVTNSLAFNSFARFTYQFATEKTLRVPYDSTMISDTKDRFTEKRGDKLDYVLESTYTFNDWFSLSPGYEMNYQAATKYYSEHELANEILGSNTERLAHNLRLSGTISSIQPFLKKKFLLPASINMKYQHMLYGKNTPKVDRFEIELRMLF